MRLFENLPSTNTPINAENLNQIQDNLVVVNATEPTGDNREKVWLQKGKNLIKKWYKGGYYSPENGDFTNGSMEFSMTDFIEIEPNKPYIFSNSENMRYGWINVFDKNFNFLEMINRDGLLETFTITNENAKYILFDLFSRDYPNLTWVQLEQGTVATPHEEYIEPKIYVKNNNNVYEEFSKNSDTGWIDLTPYVNNQIVSIREGWPPMARKINNTVYFRGELYISTEPGENSFNILEGLPSFLIPIYQATGCGITYEDCISYSMWVENGEIRVYIKDKSVQNPWKGFDLCNLAPYIVD